ncbi:MAG: UPF0104 family protein [Methanobrevibacter sp.]|uniref:UPF0104 family protein n=1 Tax=Methanobrevibacter sp. TaxID=66852 RepID=UPI001AFEAE6F|nr:UPF0104 family protein [Methanobrevibacter sp.]MBO6122503.1 UPF0104 family protein [Methanobrevibacter sp.]MBP3790470.1 UPF0104 family protein [Methanobrevibacter sp.]
MDRKTLFFLGVSILILAIMLWFVGIEEVIEALKLANLTIIGLAVLVQIGTYFLYAFRWQILNKLADMDVSIRELIPMVLVGLAVNNITPSGRGGGEPVRAYILSKQKGYPMEESFATVVADRALDTFPFVVLAAITIAAMAMYFDFDLWLLIVMVLAVIAIVALLFVLIYMCINPGFGKRVDGWIIGLVRRFYKKNSEDLEEKIHDAIFGFQDTMKLLISNKKVLSYTIPLSFLIWVFEIIRVYLVFLAFGAQVNLVVIGEVFIVASLVGMIPLLPGGLGAVDGMMIIFYSAAGISASVSAAATVIERLISFWMATILGLIILPHYGSSLLDKASSSVEIEEPSDDDLEDEG